MRPQQEGYDNSGFAIVMRDLEGVFGHYKDKPLLSLACTRKGLQLVNDYMDAQGFTQLAQWVPDVRPKAGARVDPMPVYAFRNYEFPELYRYRDRKAREELLLDTRLALREILAENNQGYAYSFWPDTLTLKEVGDPGDIADYFGLWEDDGRLLARDIVAQCRQNTNYGISRYAAHPFFLQGYVLCANGENTFYTRNTEFQKSLHRGYVGFESDSQNILYSLHYVMRELGWPARFFKHVVTPLPADEAEKRPEKEALAMIRESLSQLEINGPNAIIGLLPDGRTLAACDAKKLRPIVVGSDGETAVVTSEVCGLNAVLPERDPAKDIYLSEKETLLIDKKLAMQKWTQ